MGREARVYNRTRHALFFFEWKSALGSWWRGARRRPRAARARARAHTLRGYRIVRSTKATITIDARQPRPSVEMRLHLRPRSPAVNDRPQPRLVDTCPQGCPQGCPQPWPPRPPARPPALAEQTAVPASAPLSAPSPARLSSRPALVHARVLSMHPGPPRSCSARRSTTSGGHPLSG